MKRGRLKGRLTIRTYKEGDQAYLFMTSGSFTETTSLKLRDIMFLAKVTIKKRDWKYYDVRIDKILLDVFGTKHLFPEGQVSVFAHIWVERGEEAYKLWANPSNRFAKVE